MYRETPKLSAAQRRALIRALYIGLVFGYVAGADNAYEGGPVVAYAYGTITANISGDAWIRCGNAALALWHAGRSSKA